MNRPQTLDEWNNYIAGLAGQELFSQAVAANTQTFCRDLVAEGMSMEHVELLLLYFVRQLRRTGTKVPEGGAFDLVTMALTDEIARKGPTMSEEEAEFVATLHKEGPDDFDDFELEAAFED